MNSSGIITAKAAGSATITARTIDGTESIITVKVISKYHDAVIGVFLIIFVAIGAFAISRKFRQMIGKNQKKS